MNKLIKIIKIEEKYIEGYQYSQGYFDYSLTSDPLKAFNFEKANDFDFCTNCLKTDKIKYETENYKIEMFKT